MCKHIFSIEGENKVIVRLHHTKYIDRCNGINMELYLYLGIQTYLLFRNCVGCVFEKPCVIIGKKSILKIKRGMRTLRAIEKSYIILFFCLCYHTCIHKSTLMSHFKAKQADIKSRAPFSRRFQNAASQECPF